MLLSSKNVKRMLIDLDSRRAVRKCELKLQTDRQTEDGYSDHRRDIRTMTEYECSQCTESTAVKYD